MDPVTQKAFQILQEVKSVNVGTSDEGRPAVRIINLMLSGEDGLYFITARGKPLFQQLKKEPVMAISAMNPGFTAVRINGDISFCPGREKVDQIIQENPALGKLYAGDARNILEAIHMHRGSGEIFDLSAAPLKRERFAFGGAAASIPGYRINGQCTACGICIESCPVGVISPGDVYTIEGSHCLECGACREVCPEDAIEASTKI